MQSRFRPQFGLATLSLVLTLVSVWLAWRFTGVREDRRRLKDQIVSNHLIRAHWVNLDTAASAWSKEFDSQFKYQAHVLLPSGAFKDGTSADPFETELLGQWLKTGTPLTNEFVDRGALTYYRGVRAGSSCVRCHSHLPQGPVKAGDLIAIIKIQLPE